MNDSASGQGSATSGPEQAWHTMEADAALSALDSDPQGLSTSSAETRLRQFGANRLSPPARRGILRRVGAQFQNVLIHVLIGAGLLTSLLGHWVDASVIFGVVLINGLIGFVQEGKAERALDAIRGMLSPAATVMRDGRRTTVPAEQLVPGDIFMLGQGDRVPADLRLIETRDLRIDESALTGESVPADKSDRVVAGDAPLGDRSGIAWSGTLVAAGSGTGVVVATGDATEIGHISSMLADVTVLRTPLVRQFERFGRWLTGGILTLAAVTFAFGLLVRGYTATEMFLAAIGLAVAAIPEGLPGRRHRGQDGHG